MCTCAHTNQFQSTECPQSQPEQTAEMMEEEKMNQSPIKQVTQPGATTSDFYSVKDIPERFNHPGTYNVYTSAIADCALLGHPIPQIGLKGMVANLNILSSLHHPLCMGT